MAVRMQPIDYLEGLMEGFVAYDGDWVMTYMNAAGERLLRKSREDVIGKTWHEAFPHAVGNDVDRMYQRVMRTRQPERMEMYYPHYDEWFEISASPLTNGGVGVYFQYITARKHAEQALQAANARLLEGARRKDEFLAMLAHELRNPLAPIRNAVEVLALKTPPDPVLQQAREVIDRQLGHMVRLIDDLLDASRITSGKLELRRAPVELAAVLDEALETVRPHLRGRAFTVHLPAEPVWVDADRVRLAQVLANLLHNAAKYTEAGGAIALQAERRGDHVRIAVRDDGIGIAPEYLPHVFEMFSQAEPALARAQGGLGIGLALAQGLAQMHGGTLHAHSEGAGRGSEFTLTLPVCPPAPASARPLTVRAAASGRGGRRVLIVDDNRDSASTLAQLLALDGHEVSTAHDGDGAVRLAAQAAPDFVLLDLGLPGMNGFEVCRKLRTQPGGERLRIAAVTGWGQDEDRRRTREAGFDAHLVKPVDHDALLDFLERPPRPTALGT